MEKGFDSMKKEFSFMYLGVMMFHLIHGFFCYQAKLEFLTIYMLVSSGLYLMLAVLALVVKDIKICFFICFFEVMLFAILGSIFAGYASGYSLQLIGVIPLSFYLTYLNNKDYKHSMIYVVIEITLFFLVTIISMELKHDIPTLWAKRIYALNTVVFVILIVAFFLVFSKVTNKNEETLSKENNALKDVVNYDPLTGLMNRRSFDFYFEKKLQGVNDKGLSLCVAMCDIDNFKSVNDTYGHDFGDIVLKEMGKIIASQLRENDNLFRWGGEEFLLLLQLDDDVAINVLERIRQAIESSPITYGDITIYVTMSMGISKYQPMVSSGDLIKQADDALYESKKTGKNKVTLHK